MFRAPMSQELLASLDALPQRQSALMQRLHALLEPTGPAGLEAMARW